MVFILLVGVLVVGSVGFFSIWCWRLVVKLKARIAVSVYCPKCEFVMVKVNDQIECPNPSCVLHDQRFQMPWLPLEPLQDDEQDEMDSRARPKSRKAAMEAFKTLRHSYEGDCPDEIWDNWIPGLVLVAMKYSVGPIIKAAISWGPTDP